jgi:WD40 repeat protein
MNDIDRIGIICPRCRKQLRVRADLAGRLIRCPNRSCTTAIAVPHAGPGPLPWFAGGMALLVLLLGLGIWMLSGDEDPPEQQVATATKTVNQPATPEPRAEPTPPPEPEPKPRAEPIPAPQPKQGPEPKPEPKPRAEPIPAPRPAPKPAPEPKPVTGGERCIRLQVAQLSAIAFAPDGRRLVLGTADGRVQLRDVETGKVQELLKGVREQVSCLAFSADGRQVIAGSAGELGKGAAVRVWQVADGRLRCSFRHDQQVTGVAFATGGKRAVSCSLDTTIRLWDLETEKEVRWLGPESRQFENRFGVACVAFSPDGRQVLTGEHPIKVIVSGGRALLTATVGGMAMRIWDVATGKELCRSPVGGFGQKRGHQDRITAAVYERGGRWALTASADRTLRRWDAQTGQEQQVFRGHFGEVLCLALSADGRWALSGGGKEKAADSKYTGRIDHAVRVWDVASGKELHQFTGHPREVLQVAFLPDGQRALSASADGTVHIWKLPRSVTDTSSQARAQPPARKQKKDPPALVKKLVGTWVAQDGSGVRVTFNGAPAIILSTSSIVQGTFYSLERGDTLRFSVTLAAGFGDRVRVQVNAAGNELRIVLASGRTILLKKTR